MRAWRLVGLLAAGSLAGCATAAQTREPVTTEVGEGLVSDQELQHLGNRIAEVVKQKMGVVEDPQVQQYVEAVGHRILASVPRDQRRFNYTFTVVDEPRVNAFALPGGHIFVTSGLLDTVEGEAELASVLAHEVAHVTEGHVHQKIAAQYGVSELRSLALGRHPRTLAELGTQIAAQGYLATYSRDEEREAEATGRDLVRRAGYTP